MCAKRSRRYSSSIRQRSGYREQRPGAVEDIKTVVIFSTLGIAVASGAFLFVRHFYKQSRAKAAQSKSLTQGDPSTFAKQLKMAFDNDTWLGWGTNEELIFQVFDQIASQSEYQKVQKAYFDMYGSNLNSDLEDELSSEDYNKFIQVLSSKPQR